MENKFTWITNSEKKKKEFLKHLKNKTVEEQFIIAVENSCEWLVEQCVNSGLDCNKYVINIIEYKSFRFTDGKFETLDVFETFPVLTSQIIKDFNNIALTDSIFEYFKNKKLIKIINYRNEY